MVGAELFKILLWLFLMGRAIVCAYFLSVNDIGVYKKGKSPTLLILPPSLPRGGHCLTDIRDFSTYDPAIFFYHLAINSSVVFFFLQR